MQKEACDQLLASADRRRLYKDPEILDKQPVIGKWLSIFEQAVPPPLGSDQENLQLQPGRRGVLDSRHSLSGNGSAADNRRAGAQPPSAAVRAGKL
ncbi:MAG: hypothetical protein R3C97_14655 [Geminicoccaceae bacterium]